MIRMGKCDRWGRVWLCGRLIVCLADYVSSSALSTLVDRFVMLSIRQMGSSERQFLKAAISDSVAGRTVLRCGAAVADDGALLFAFNVHIDAGHP